MGLFFEEITFITELLGSNFLLSRFLTGGKWDFQVAYLLLATTNFEPSKDIIRQVDTVSLKHKVQVNREDFGQVGQSIQFSHLISRFSRVLRCYNYEKRDESCWSRPA